MKNNKNNPQSKASQWADEVLNSLDGINRASANPFLYTRIMARMEGTNSAWEKIASLLSRPAFAFACIIVFVSINIGVILNDQKSKREELANTAMPEQMLAGEFTNAQTYSLVEINEDK